MKKKKEKVPYFEQNKYFNVMYSDTSGHCYWIKIDRTEDALICIALLGSNQNIKLCSILKS